MFNWGRMVGFFLQWPYLEFLSYCRVQDAFISWEKTLNFDTCVIYVGVAWPAVDSSPWQHKPVELDLVFSTHTSPDSRVSETFLIFVFTTHLQILLSLLCDSGKPMCVGVAVIFTPCVFGHCQLDNVLLHQLYFAVCDLTVAIPLPSCSHIEGGELAM